ncbi:MAG TPA: transporter substrate-binding domain-containing protein [Pseudomonas sp.]|nr:transporter substrate-binding domain-containing protein [Pseudomonas sp.]
MLQLFTDLKLRWRVATTSEERSPWAAARPTPSDKPAISRIALSFIDKALRAKTRAFAGFFKRLAALLMVIASCTHAAESPTALRFATVDNFPPFSYMENGNLTGIDIDLVYEMARRINISVQIQTYPWARVMGSVKSGEFDGAFAAFETAERQAFCLYVGVLHVEEFYLFVRKDNAFPYTQIPDLYGKRVGIDRGVYVGEAFERAVNDGRIALEEVNDMGMINIRKLNAGRIDAVIGDLGVMNYHLKLLGLEQRIVALQPIREPTPAYLVLSKASQLKNKVELQDRMRRALHDMWNDGTYHLIYNRYVYKVGGDPLAR